MQLSHEASKLLGGLSCLQRLAPPLTHSLPPVNNLLPGDLQHQRNSCWSSVHLLRCDRPQLEAAGTCRCMHVANPQGLCQCAQRPLVLQQQQLLATNSGTSGLRTAPPPPHPPARVSPPLPSGRVPCAAAWRHLPCGPSCARCLHTQAQYTRKRHSQQQHLVQITAQAAAIKTHQPGTAPIMLRVTNAGGPCRLCAVRLSAGHQVLLPLPGPSR